VQARQGGSVAPNRSHVWRSARLPRADPAFEIVAVLHGDRQKSAYNGVSDATTFDLTDGARARHSTCGRGTAAVRAVPGPQIAAQS